MKKLYRSSRNQVIGGVAGGLAEYLGVDVTVMRLLFAFAAVIMPQVILAYLLAWMIVPAQNEVKAIPSTGNAPVPSTPGAPGEDAPQGAQPPTAQDIFSGTQTGTGADALGPVTQGVPSTPSGPDAGGAENQAGRQVLGYFLIALGGIVLLKRVSSRFSIWFPVSLLWKWWPITIILLGAALIWSALQGGRRS